MPPPAARVVSIEKHADLPQALRHVYAGRSLVAIALEAAPPGWKKVGHPVHGDWVFELDILPS